jgi:hypothetical protein
VLQRNPSSSTLPVASVSLPCSATCRRTPRCKRVRTSYLYLRVVMIRCLMSCIGWYPPHSLVRAPSGRRRV